MRSSIPAIANRTLQVAALLIAATYLITGIVYLCLSYWPCTETDFWQIYEVCFYYPWWKSALFKIHNHSLFFPSLIWLADLHFFNGSQLMLFVVGLGLQVICTLLLLLPIWRDQRLDLTAKSLAAMMIVVVSFWMGRAAITTSGGFNCITSLALLGALSAFLLLPRLQSTSHSQRGTIGLVIAWAFVATFSFGSGAAVWPTLLFLGWALRLPSRALATILIGALVAVAIYQILPPPEDRSELWQSLDSTPVLAVESLKHLCRFLGAPVFYSIKAWEGVGISRPLVESSGELIFIGATGLCIAFLALGVSCFRRNLRGQQIELLGLALIAFNLGVAFLAVISRVERFQELPADSAAPRYLFWSSLFWTGIVLLALVYGSGRRWLRGPAIALVLVFAIGGWQEHRDEGLHWRYARLLAEEGATSLINGVTDPARLLAPTQDRVDALVPQLRARRLDMFAEGLHDWIGQPVSKLFPEKDETISFRGRASIQRLTGGRDADRAVKVTGQRFAKDSSTRATMIIVAPDGKVAGIARSFHSNPLLNRLLYGGRMPNGRIGGYIQSYDPTSRYALRAVDKDGVSREMIGIAPAPKGK